MDFPAVLLVAIALGTDAFSLATGLGMGGIRRRLAVFFSGAVGLLHVLMPLAGLYLGFFMGRLLGRLAAIVGAIVLATIGILMLWEALAERRQPGSLGRRLGKSLLGEGVIQGVSAVLLLAGSVSLDALSVGFGLGALRANLPLTVLAMGLVAAVMTAAGFILGRRAGHWLGDKAEIAGGLILVIIGLKMLVGR
ncbi:MAG: manganese efflux pump [Thermoanaerobacteraceae bacterium]|uniref:manganese efflux pump MntP n=1 Tax=Thermanaeromonas sp. C210 TaxID=2731925 RepID=UPI00155C34EC|nr:manganese efflux pump MntP family protein [Thermanaeromonas sp. C210]MBE3580181.1 manganese efflux pump [Thermoanaerobacteraceae bacterium]GFN22984.1 putative manganese efflux pump MntP [Thermanaeromonas sp. C210]